ncbi:MAG: FtsQ-type POTRA domain-containing protein [Patescibacteria group bacterium]
MSNISSKYQKDFKNSDYKNPRLIRDEQLKQKRVGKLVSLVSLVLLVSLAYFLFFAPFFTIKEIEINGLNKIKKENIDQIANDYRYQRDWLIFSRNNFWLFDKDDLTEKIFSHYFFEEFKINKHWPNRITITLKEKESAINWLTNNLCYHLDLTGLAIEYCEENNGYLTIKDLSDNKVEVGDRTIETKDLQYILELYQQLQKVLDKKLNIAYIEKTNNLLDFVTKEGIVIKLNSNLTPQEQVARLETLLNQQEIKENLLKMKYFDLRFGEKIYYQ